MPDASAGAAQPQIFSLLTTLGSAGRRPYVAAKALDITDLGVTTPLLTTSAAALAATDAVVAAITPGSAALANLRFLDGFGLSTECRLSTRSTSGSRD